MVKKSFVLRIDAQTYAQLEKWASDDFRSVNGQIEMIIDKALRESGRKKNIISSTTKGKLQTKKTA